MLLRAGCDFLGALAEFFVGGSPHFGGKPPMLYFAAPYNFEQSRNLADFWAHKSGGPPQFSTNSRAGTLERTPQSYLYMDPKCFFACIIRLIAANIDNFPMPELE